MSDVARPQNPRILPLLPGERSESARAILDNVRNAEKDRKSLATMVRAEELSRRWLQFGGRLASGKIPARDRELMVLRTAWNCTSEYIWAEHSPVGQAAGLSREQIAAIPAGGTEGWDVWDVILLAAVDELHNGFCITDETWTGLADRYDVPQLIELPMLVGHYEMLAMTFITLGVQLDDDSVGFT